MGVSGCGKSTIGGILAGRLGWPLEEGDDLHPAENVAKMAAGHPLDDADRKPWLERIREWIDEREAAGESGIVTCSALRRQYRDVLRDDSGHPDSSVRFVFLDGTRELLLSRLTARQGHFMPAALLDSQLDTLEPPDEDEQAVRIDIRLNPVVQAETILDTLALE